MPTVSETPLSTEQLFYAVEQLPTRELEKLAAKVFRLRVKRTEPRRLTRRETELLQAINRAAPQEVRQRFDELYARRHELAPVEQEELLRLNDQLEMLNAERLEKLLALARIRKTTLCALMDDLGLKPPPI
jgi:hypothetical protein